MARSITRVHQGDSLDVPSCQDNQAATMNGKLVEKDAKRVLKRDKYMQRLSSPRKVDGKKPPSTKKIARRSVKQKPPQQQLQQQWETETASTCTTSASATNREQQAEEPPTNDNLLPPHTEQQEYERSSSLRDMEIFLPKHKELLQYQHHQQQWQWSKNIDAARRHNKRYDVHRRLDLGEVKRKGMKNTFEYDPPSTKACYYNYYDRNMKEKSEEVDDSGESNDDESISGEVRVEADDDDAISKSSGSAKSAAIVRPWHRTENDTGNVATRGKTRKDVRSSERNSELRNAVIFHKKMSSGSLSCEIEKAVDALALFSKSDKSMDYDSEAEDTSEEEGHQPKQYPYKEARTDDDRREDFQMSKNTNQNRVLPSTPTKRPIKRRSKSKKSSSVTLHQVFDWYFGRISSSSSSVCTKQKKKKKRKSSSSNSRRKTTPLPVCKEQKRFLIASTKRRKKKTKKTSKVDIKYHNLIVLQDQQRIMKQNSKAKINDGQDRSQVDVEESLFGDDDSTSKSHSEKESTKGESLSDIIGNVNTCQSKNEILNSQSRQDSIKWESLKYDDGPSVKISIEEEQSEQSLKDDSINESNHDSIMKFLTAAPGDGEDDALEEKSATSLFDTPTAFDLQKSGKSLFGGGESSLFGYA